MNPWTDQQRESVLRILRRIAGGSGTLADEARSLVRWLDPPLALPPEADGENSPGGWLVAEERAARRKALVVQLSRAPGHRLPASRISIPGITDRSALHRWLTRQVRCGFLRRTEAPPKNPGGFPVGWYSLVRPQKT